MIPLTVDVPMKRLPWANWGLILATVVVSLDVPYVLDEANLRHPEFSALVLQRDRFAAYQLVTSLFQHAGLLHLIPNMVFLFVFGNPINAKLGHVAFLASYLGMGVLANVVWLVGGEGAACLGASAAIMGLCGMFLVLYPRNEVKVFWDDFEVALITRTWTGEVPGWALVLFYLAFDVWGAIFDRDSNIGHVSHIVGGVAGVGLALTLLKAGWLTPDRGEQTLLQWLAGEGPVEQEAVRRPKGGKRSRALSPEDH
jgi:membrane associated rhomboid family serine protease